MTTFNETDHPRAQDGTFTEKERSAPEASLAPTPHQLGIIGLGPASKNDFSEPFDVAGGERPLRPYLPLTPADDDEFFDSPTGSVVTCSDKGTVSRYEKLYDGSWVTLSERGVPHTLITAGDVWASLFREDGTMRSAKLDLPLGTLYGDGSGFVYDADVDKPLSSEEVIKRLHGKVVRMVSHDDFGDERASGLAANQRGAMTFDVRDGRVTLAGRGKNPYKHEFNLAKVHLFDREGDTVVLNLHSPQYGYEFVLRADD